jgi:hypothetical protein
MDLHQPSPPPPWGGARFIQFCEQCGKYFRLEQQERGQMPDGGWICKACWHGDDQTKH